LTTFIFSLLYHLGLLLSGSLVSSVYSDLDSVLSLLVVESLSLLGRVLVGLSLSLLDGGISSDGSMSLLVESLESFSLNSSLDVSGEDLGELLVVLLSQKLHVISNVSSEDVLSKDIGVELVSLIVVSNVSSL